MWAGVALELPETETHDFGQTRGHKGTCSRTANRKTAGPHHLSHLAILGSNFGIVISMRPGPPRYGASSATKPTNNNVIPKAPGMPAMVRRLCLIHIGSPNKAVFHS